MSSGLHERRDRAESFGSVAEEYDRFRPSYPDALLDDLAALRPASVLDIGCGTGKAARALAERGLDVLGLEVDARMAAVARRHGVPVEVSAFETWDDRDRSFDLIIAAQAWHWIDPVAGPAKAARLLRPGGTLALFWNHEDGGTEFDAAYRAHAPHLADAADPAPGRPSYADRLTASGLFTDVTAREYPWQRTYTAAEWVGYARTHSDHLLLPAAQLDALTAAMTAAIDARGGTITVRGGTYTVLARTDTG
jgi:SAM-dependent methyltransferase